MPAKTAMPRTATPAYFDLVNGKFQMVPDGVMPGVQWDDVNGNLFQAVMFMPNFSSLQYGQSLEFIYAIETKPVGFDNWLSVKNQSHSITNNNYVNTTSGAWADPSVATTTDPETGVITVNTGYMTQFDFWIDGVFKGTIPSPPLYDLMIDEMIRVETATTY